MKQLGMLRWAIVVGVMTTGAMLGCDMESNSRATVHATTQANPVERGRYLVTIAACADCHTPFKMGEHGPEPDMTRWLSGHPQDLKMPIPEAPQGPWIGYLSATNTAFAGPWGITFAANLTPDRQTGIGIWTEEMFITAIREGKHMGVVDARPIMPPMPWPYYRQMSDDDLKAIFAYLRSLEPISNDVPAWLPPGSTDDEAW